MAAAAAGGALPTRRAYTHAGRTIYEWEQGFEEVNVYVPLPPGTPRRALDAKIGVGHLRVGLVGNPPYLDAALCGPVVLEDSTWTLGACVRACVRAAWRARRGAVLA